jgi:perosamine synthetase
VLSLGPLTEQFERRFADLYGFEHAVAVSTGTTALQIALLALDVQGGTVLCPANTNYATGGAIIGAGARLELYDSDVYPDVDDLASRLTPAVRAVVVVHIGGFCSPELRRLVKICARAGVPVVEDCAHSHGAAIDGIPAGRHGLVGAFSFFPTKPVTTGEGGLIVTGDADIAAKARSYRNQGKDAVGEYVLAGSSWRLPELSAAVGLAQLSDAEHDRVARVELAASFDAALEGSGLTPVAVLGRQRPNFHKYICLSPTPEARDRAIRYLLQRGVSPAGSVYAAPLSALPVFASLGLEALPRATVFSRSHVCPPLWTRMPRDAADRVRSALSSMQDER